MEIKILRVKGEIESTRQVKGQLSREREVCLKMHKERACVLWKIIWILCFY